jgi:hypothetical protein
MSFKMLQFFSRRANTVQDEAVAVARLPLGEGSRGGGGKTASDPRLLQIARQSIHLSAAAPLLARTASELEAAAQQQAQTAAEVARATREITGLLDAVMVRLEGSAGDISGLIKTVGRVSDHIRILALNAGIEAARAGQHGLAFAVVASEVQRLADETARANGEVGSFVTGIRRDVKEAAQVVGHDGETSGTEAALSVHALNDRMRLVESSARSQLESASRVDDASRRVRELSEQLVICVGTFRTEAHHEALRQMELLVADSRLRSPERSAREVCLRDFVGRHAAFELAYMTNAAGIQTTSNVWRNGKSGTGDALGTDWSKRPWFRLAAAGEGPAVSDVYRSVANDRFCLTVSAPLRDAEGRLLAVVAADVDFQSLLDLISG